MATMSDAYLARVEDALAEDLALIPGRILALLRSLAPLQQGFAVDQLVHSLQTATRADRAGADLDVVVASLCHDMGKTLTNVNHPAIAAEMIKPWVHADAYWMVLVHQDFQGLHYYGRMGLDPMMRRRHAGHPAYELAERFADEWDQTSFDSGYDTLPLEHFAPMVREVFSRPPRR
jgi:predicted HD phosphohydrolase